MLDGRRSLSNAHYLRGGTRVWPLTRLQRPPTRRRIKISITVDPDLLGSVDDFVAEHAEYDRSRVFDVALRLWYAHEQDQAMEAQFLAPLSTTEAEEQAAWSRIQAAAASLLFGLD